VRLVCAGILLAVLVARATRLIGTTSVDVIQLFSSLPGGLIPEFRSLQAVGTLWALGLVVVAAVVGRRWRLARDLLLAGVVAWGLSRVLGSDVVGQIGLHASLRTLTHSGGTPNFPTVRLAVLVAVVATAGPYVARPTRRLGQVLVVAFVVAGMYAGTAYPDDLVAALVVGWGIAAAVHLVFGLPAGRLTSLQLSGALADVGIAAQPVRLSPHQEPDATTFESADQSGPLEVKVIGRDQLDAQLLAKAWRFVAYKEPAPALQVTRVQQIEHEACMTLLAGSAGVHAPRVVFVGPAGPAVAVLIVRPLQGVSLADVEASAVTDPLLTQLWQQVALLHAAGIAHGALDAAHVVCSECGPGILSFATASTARSGYRQAKDVAELLAATAGIVGDERAVAVCADVLGDLTIKTALPFLQPAALRRHTRSALDDDRGVRDHLDGLRRLIASRLGIDPPAVRQLQRLRPASVLLAASTLVAVVALLDRVGDPSNVWEVTRHADWGWTVVALAVSLASNLPYAVALMGTLPLRIPLWPTTELQVAVSYSNLVVPVIGGTGLQIRFLQRLGADLAAAVTAGGLLSVVGTVITQVPLLVLAVWVSPDALHLGSVSVSGVLQIVGLVIVILGVAAAIAFGIPRLRRAILPPVEQAVAVIWAATRSRRQLSLIVVGNLVATLMTSFCLLCCLYAFGATLSFWTVVAITIAVGTIAALVPVPGGGSAVGAVGLTGLLAGLGVHAETAVAVTFAFQLTVTYLPALPGWLATRHLLHHDYL
jgi:uncharacterized membrane protein YbhN (UPF0104 family)/tRNA A-37 threonylcarbamoyl transferase component Bud32